MNNLPKGEYERYQYGGSFGGPIVQNKAHFFAAYERTQQDTTQSVNTLGLFPAQDGVFPTPMRENLFTAKGSCEHHADAVPVGPLRPQHQLAGLRRNDPPRVGQLGRQRQHVQLVQHEPQLGAPRGIQAERVRVPGMRTSRTTSRLAPAPTGDVPERRHIGYNTNTPQTTEQRKCQFRDDFSWYTTGMGGLGHDFKAGVNYINEPRLFVTFSSGSTDYAYTHLDLNIGPGPISAVSRNKAGASANLPMKQFGMYFQDDWRVNDRLTVNAGMRYDLVTGFDIDQSGIQNFVTLTGAAAGRALQRRARLRRVRQTYWRGREQLAAAHRRGLRPSGNGKDVIRAGWGIYYDFGYTNATILFPGLSAQGGSGMVFSVTGKTAGIRTPTARSSPSGSQSQHRQPERGRTRTGPFFGSTWRRLASGSRGPASSPLGGRTSCRQRPCLRHRLRAHRRQGPRRAVGAQHRDQWRRSPLCRACRLNPANPTMNMSVGESKFDGVNFSIRRRLDKGISLSAWYSLSKAKGLGGQGVDELTTNLVQDSINPYADVQLGPVAADRRASQDHVERGRPDAVGHLRIADFRYRSALPLFTSDGYDNNADGVNNDIYPTAFKFTDVDDIGVPIVQGHRRVQTVNCGRGAALSQFNLRVSKVFSLPYGMNVEGIVEGFNLFNAINPTTPLAFLLPARSSPARGQPSGERGVHEADGLRRRCWPAASSASGRFGFRFTF